MNKKQLSELDCGIFGIAVCYGCGKAKHVAATGDVTKNMLFFLSETSRCCEKREYNYEQ